VRLVTVACRMRHLALYWGQAGVVFVWPLAMPRRGVPWLSLTTARQSGGTFAARFGPLLLLWGGR
jgi:hypothetical protein